MAVHAALRTTGGVVTVCTRAVFVPASTPTTTNRPCTPLTVTGSFILGIYRAFGFDMPTVSHRLIQDASPVDFKLHHYRTDR